MIVYVCCYTVCIQYTCQCKRVGCVCVRDPRMVRLSACLKSPMRHQWAVTCGNRTHTLSQQRQTWHTDWIVSQRYTHPPSHSISIFPEKPHTLFSLSWPLTGGRQGKLPVTAFESFDLEMKSWTRYPCIPSRRAFCSCAATDGAFFSLGGLQQPGPHNFYSRPHFVSTVEEFDCEQGEQTSLANISVIFPKPKLSFIDRMIRKRNEVLECQDKYI